MVVITLYRFPGGLPNVQEARAFSANELVYHVFRAAIDWCLYVPSFPCPVTLMCVGIRAMDTHSACSSALVALFEADRFSPRSAFQRHFRSNECVAEIRVSLVAHK